MSRVITYSIYGNNPFYINGAINNAKLKPYGSTWQTWFYVYEDVSKENLEKLSHYADKIIKIPYNFPIKHGMFWRFLAICDDNVECMLVRDVDSMPTEREIKFVNEWIKSDKSIHIIRDAPTHQIPFLGGIFGFKKPLPFDFHTLLMNNSHYWNNNHIYNRDQLFLAHVIYPLTTNNRLVHDSYNHYELDGHITTDRSERFIGEKILENGRPEGYDILEKMENNYIYFHYDQSPEFSYKFYYNFMEQLQIARILQKTLVIPLVKYYDTVVSLNAVLDLSEVNSHYAKLISLDDYIKLNISGIGYNTTNNTINTTFGNILINEVINTDINAFNILKNFRENSNSILANYMPMTMPNWHMEGCKFLNYDFDYFTVRMSILNNKSSQNLANEYAKNNNIRTTDTLYVNNSTNVDDTIKNILELKLKNKNIGQILLENNDDVMEILKSFRLRVFVIDDYIIRSLVAAQCKYQLHGGSNYTNMDLYGRWILEERKRYYFNSHYITTMEVFSDVYFY